MPTGLQKSEVTATTVKRTTVKRLRCPLSSLLCRPSIKPRLVRSHSPSLAYSTPSSRCLQMDFETNNIPSIINWKSRCITLLRVVDTQVGACKVVSLDVKSDAHDSASSSYLLSLDNTCCVVVCCLHLASRRRRGCGTGRHSPSQQLLIPPACHNSSFCCSAAHAALA